MSRFQGYVGIANYMGARFTASEPALAPVLREAAKRGLIYLDDGSSPRSLASQIAGANNLPFAKADMVLDAVPTRGRDRPRARRGWRRIGARARRRGRHRQRAAGRRSSASPNGRRRPKSRGILLVPITAVANKAEVELTGPAT